MNLLRIHRKSKHKIKLRTIFFFIFFLIMTTFAWFAYSKVLNSTLKFHVASWDMEYWIGGEKQESNSIEIGIDELYPTMPEKSVTIEIKNNGEKNVEIDYKIDSVKIANTEYEVIYEGQSIDAENYIIMSPSVVETSSVVEDEVTIVTKTVKGAIIKDLEKFPFTVDLEHSYEIESENGTGYLNVKVNWVGDNNKLDSEWGYIVGDATTTAMSIGITIDAYQQEDIPTERTTIMPSTTETTPYLPTGFTKVAGTTLETGLTIKDSLGNEYVWVEVPKNASVYQTTGLGKTEFSDAIYTSIENDLKNYTNEYRNGTANQDSCDSSTFNITGLSESRYNEFKKKMLKSIYTNGGFYIGKYETGIESTPRISASTNLPTPVIKQNVYPYNFVKCEQAESLAESMESGNNSSSLMFGIQWDLVLKYLEVKGTSRQTNTIDEIKNDSGNWGNYQNSLWTITSSSSKYAIGSAYSWVSQIYGEKEQIQDDENIILSTGATSTFCKQNIYDLAGNVAEWTIERSSDENKPTVYRGADFTSQSESKSASIREIGTKDVATRNIGFRVTIY